MKNILVKAKLSEKGLKKALELGIPEQQRREEAMLDVDRLAECVVAEKNPFHARKRKPDTGIQLIKGDEVFADVSWVMSDLIDAGYRLESISCFRKNVKQRSRRRRRGKYYSRQQQQQQQQQQEQQKGGFLQMHFSQEAQEHLELEPQILEFVDLLLKDTWMHVHVWDNSGCREPRPVTLNLVSRTTQKPQNSLRLKGQEWKLSEL